MKSPHASSLLVSGCVTAGASENAVHSVLAAGAAAGTGEEGGGAGTDTLAAGADEKAPQMSLLEAGTVVAAGVGANEANEDGACCGCGGACCAGCGAFVSQLCWVREDTSALSADGSAMPGIICGNSTGASDYPVE